MKKLKKIILIFVLILFVAGCGSKKYEVNKETSLTGTITTSEITKDEKTYKINILNLNEPIVVNGIKVNKIAIDYDKALKNNTEVTIDGVIQTNSNSSIDLEYSISVNDVDNILSYINTFSNDDFSMTIPVDIIKLCNIETIDNGFVINKTNSSNEKVELFKVISVSNEEFNKLRDNEEMNIEKAASNREKTVIVVYSSTNLSDDDYEEYDQIMKNVDSIKDSVVLK